MATIAATHNAITKIPSGSPLWLWKLYLSCLGMTLTIAFWSYYVQFPGLNGSSGIDPAERLMPFAAATLYKRLITAGYMDVDSCCELLAVMGLGLSSLVAVGWLRHGSVFLLLTCIYCTLVRTGGTFYSFQWDILLLETTFLTGLCYAPWVPSLSSKSTALTGVGAWPLRFLLFKLMLMSGVVKLQASCPTWLQLTALEYHFATQCLPGPLAWYAHQFPPFLLRLSVAVTLWIEIPLAYLLVAPLVSIRRKGAVLQILLQGMIILTGNYNFFNVLTMALCLPCIAKDDFGLDGIQWTSFYRRLFVAQTLLLSWFTFKWMFRVTYEAGRLLKTLNVTLKMTQSKCETWLALTIPVTLWMVLLLLFWRAGVGIARDKSLTLPLQSLVCVAAILVTSYPLSTLTTPGLTSQMYGAWDDTVEMTWLQYGRIYSISNPYGLFRRMTGVGAVSPAAQRGWAGQPSSVVERPEIIIEVLFDDEDDGSNNSTADESWYELDFRWKPGSSLGSLPRQVAPHQPRLDWQMWFAALGSYRNNPWLVHLIRKLLQGCKPVVDLVGDSSLHQRSIRMVRAKLYHYDFTRWDTPWARGIPGAEILTSEDTTTSTRQQVWSRKFVRTYLPAIERNNPSLVQYLEGQRYRDLCYDNPMERCVDANSYLWCSLSVMIRTWRLYLLPVSFVMVVTLVGIVRWPLATACVKEQDVAECTKEAKVKKE